MRKLLVSLAALAAVLLLVLALPAGRSLSQQMMEVVVQNFPETQQVDGRVAVLEPVPHSKTVRFLEVVVPPVGREETASLIEGEVEIEKKKDEDEDEEEDETSLSVAGYTGVVLSLQGTVKGTLGRAGQVGAILVPDEEAVERAFREDGLIQLPLEVFAVLARRGIENFSAQQHLAAGFPRYKVYFYNSTDKSVEVNLYVYLTQ